MLIRGETVEIESDATPGPRITGLPLADGFNQFGDRRLRQHPQPDMDEKTQGFRELLQNGEAFKVTVDHHLGIAKFLEGPIERNHGTIMALSELSILGVRAVAVFFQFPQKVLGHFDQDHPGHFIVLDDIKGLIQDRREKRLHGVVVRRVLQTEPDGLHLFGRKDQVHLLTHLRGHGRLRVLVVKE